MASIAHIDGVMAEARRSFRLPESVEISIETTPRIAATDADKIHAYHALGIRRISMGVQTTDFKLAADLGRNDTDFLRRAVHNIRGAGFSRFDQDLWPGTVVRSSRTIVPLPPRFPSVFSASSSLMCACQWARSFNIDLMYGFPVRAGGSDHWEETLRNTLALQPDHITLYRMRYKGTRMAGQADRVGLAQVNRQAEQAARILAEQGYTGLVGKNTYRWVGFAIRSTVRAPPISVSGECPDPNLCPTGPVISGFWPQSLKNPVRLVTISCPGRLLGGALSDYRCFLITENPPAFSSSASILLCRMAWLPISLLPFTPLVSLASSLA